MTLSSKTHKEMVHINPARPHFLIVIVEMLLSKHLNLKFKGATTVGRRNDGSD